MLDREEQPWHWKRAKHQFFAPPYVVSTPVLHPNQIIFLRAVLHSTCNMSIDTADDRQTFVSRNRLKVAMRQPNSNCFKVVCSKGRSPICAPILNTAIHIGPISSSTLATSVSKLPNITTSIFWRWSLWLLKYKNDGENEYGYLLLLCLPNGPMPNRLWLEYWQPSGQDPPNQFETYFIKC